MKRNTCYALLLLLCFLCGCSGPMSTSSATYDVKDLESSRPYNWVPTNSMPLSPDAAVVAAIKFENADYAVKPQWEVESLDLEKINNIWYYSIFLSARESGQIKTRYVRVLMSGRIWKPNDSHD